MTAPVTVTAEDRECAAQIMELQERKEMADLIRAGDRDSSNTVQIAARHRQQAEAASKAREDALETLVADAYYVLTYVQELAGDDVTRAACQSVRDQIDATRAKASSDGGAAE